MTRSEYTCCSFVAVKTTQFLEHPLNISEQTFYIHVCISKMKELLIAVAGVCWRQKDNRLPLWIQEAKEREKRSLYFASTYKCHTVLNFKIPSSLIPKFGFYAL